MKERYQTLSTLVINRTQQHAKRTGVTLLGTSAFLALFQMIYHSFSHGVRSFSLEWAWAIVFGGGLVWLAIFYVFHGRPLPEAYRLGYHLFFAGIATLSAAAILAGILDIAGTSSHLIGPFAYLGAGLSLVALIIWIITAIRAKGNRF